MSKKSVPDRFYSGGDFNDIYLRQQQDANLNKSSYSEGQDVREAPFEFIDVFKDERYKKFWQIQCPQCKANGKSVMLYWVGQHPLMWRCPVCEKDYDEKTLGIKGSSLSEKKSNEQNIKLNECPKCHNQSYFQNENGEYECLNRDCSQYANFWGKCPIGGKHNFKRVVKKKRG